MNSNLHKSLYITGQMAGRARASINELVELRNTSRDRSVALSPRAQELLEALLGEDSLLGELTRELDDTADRIMDELYTG